MAIEKDTLIEILKDELSNKQSKLYKEVAEIVKNEVLEHLHTDNGTNLWWDSPLPDMQPKPFIGEAREKVEFTSMDVDMPKEVLKFLQSKFPNEDFRLFLIKDLKELSKECSAMSELINQLKDVNPDTSLLRIFLKG